MNQLSSLIIYLLPLILLLSFPVILDIFRHVMQMLDNIQLEPLEFYGPISNFFSFGTTRFPNFYRLLATRLEIPLNAKNLLEVGGGAGNFSIEVAKMYPFLKKIVTSDISKDMMKHARRIIKQKRLDGKILTDVQDVENLRYNDNTFDVAISLFSFHHWQNPVKGIQELYRIIKPDGKLIIIDGYNRPSTKELYQSIMALRGSAKTPRGLDSVLAAIGAAGLWIGTKDFRFLSSIKKIIKNTRIKSLRLNLFGHMLFLIGDKGKTMMHS